MSKKQNKQAKTKQNKNTLKFGILGHKEFCRATLQRVYVVSSLKYIYIQNPYAKQERYPDWIYQIQIHKVRQHYCCVLEI